MAKTKPQSVKREPAKPRYRPADPARAVCALVEALPDGATLFVGIDPGLTGAIAYMPPTKRHTPVVLDIPTYSAKVQTNRKGKRTEGVRTSFDHATLCTYLDPLVDHRERLDIVICLERGQPRPGDRGLTAFAIGLGYGLWHLYFTAFGLAWEEARPSVWKQQMGLTSKGKDGEVDKDSSRRLATQLFPHAAPYFTGKSDHNRAEAALIAEWLRRRRAGQPMTKRKGVRQ